MDDRASCHRVPLDGTEVRFDLALGERSLSVRYDPRDDGSALYLSTQVWTVPAGLAISDSERERLLDALWAEVSSADGLALVETLPDRREIAHRMTGEFRVLVYDGALGYLEPGRTMIIDTKPGREALTHDNVKLVREGARWIYPERRPATDAEWRAAARRLASATSDAFYREVTDTKIEVDPALIAEPPSDGG